MDDELLRLLGQHQREDLEVERRPEDPPPLAGEEREALLDDLFERLDAEADDPAPPESTGTEAGAAVIDLAARRSRLRPVALLGSLAAVAAALVLIWMKLGDPGTEPQLAQVDIPAYEVSQLRGGVASTRAEPSQATTEPVVLEAASPIDWVFTPRQAIHEPLAVALVATPDSGAASVFVAEVEARISSEGAVRLQGPLDQFIALAPGSWTLAVLVAPAEQLPRTSAELEGAVTWQRIVIPLRVQ